jgi:hypothetical protein
MPIGYEVFDPLNQPLAGFAAPPQVADQHWVARRFAPEYGWGQTAFFQKPIDAREQIVGHGAAFPDESEQIGNILVLGDFLLV